MIPLQSRLVASPACLPSRPLEDLLPLYQKLGFTKIELFTEWSDSRVDWRGDPAPIRALLARHGFTATSMHLPTVREPLQDAVANALTAAHYASALGAGIVLFKAGNRDLYARSGPMFLDALDRSGLRVTPVLQNHAGTTISTVADFRAVFEALGDDPRMKALLEVGHFQRVGTGWRQGWDLLAERIALIHLNDIRAGQSVHYGEGEVDFTGLMRFLASCAYSGDLVVELELADQLANPGETLSSLRRAVALLNRFYVAP